MIDFALQSKEEDGVITIADTAKGLTFATIPNTDNELVAIVEEPALLYAQSLVIFGTLLKGELSHAPEMGIEAGYKVLSNRSSPEGVYAKQKVLEQTASMVQTFLAENEEMLNFALESESEMQHEGTDEFKSQE